MITTRAGVCFEGYVMDRFCINRGTLLDNNRVKTLLNPELHSLHCLVDVDRCLKSGFEILATLSTKTGDASYCPAYRIGGDSGFDNTVKLARELGNKAGGCSTCTGSTVDKGFRALFVGKVSSGATWSADKPPVLEVTQVLEAGSKCPNGLAQTQPACGEANQGSRLGRCGQVSLKGGLCLCSTFSRLTTYIHASIDAYNIYGWCCTLDTTGHASNALFDDFVHVLIHACRLLLRRALREEWRVLC